MTRSSPIDIVGRESYARLVNAGYAVVEEDWVMRTRRLVFYLEDLLTEYQTRNPGVLTLDESVTLEGKPPLVTFEELLALIELRDAAIYAADRSGLGSDAVWEIARRIKRMPDDLEAVGC
jgi:hypothetical protein